jgi:hypothetical protein
VSSALQRGRAHEEHLRRQADGARKFLGAKTVSELQAENVRLRTELEIARKTLEPVGAEVRLLRERNDALQWALVLAHSMRGEDA